MQTTTISGRQRPSATASAPILGTLLGAMTSLFSRKRPVVSEAAGDSTTGLSRMEATRPAVSRREQERVDKATPRASTPTSRRAERLARRDQVFHLVRESMVRAGVLSSGYKFKVLSLDQRGAQFLVMMDLAAEFGGQTERLAEIEALIAQSAKHRYNILVQAVYWRFNEHVVLGRPADRSAPVAVAVAPSAVVPQAFQRVTVEPIRVAAPRYEPLLEDEVMAFKRALEAGVLPAPAKPMPIKRSGLLLTGYEDTEVADENEGMPALSSTQYGDLPLH